MFEQAVNILRAKNAILRQQMAVFRGELLEGQECISELEQGRKQRPSFAKPNKPKKAGRKEPRWKRKPEQNRARRRETPTKSVSHKREECPDCGDVYG